MAFVVHLLCTSGTGTTAGWTVCCSPVLSGFCVESIVHRPKKISLWLGGSFVTGLLGAASSSTEAVDALLRWVFVRPEAGPRSSISLSRREPPSLHQM
ncbi:hypothetical protein CPB85DRAFT_673769 [Mucidula mucida]|nr:hypothetical protein CPB85DRAFT_673769 [Mucidula mucida]